MLEVWVSGVHSCWLKLRTAKRVLYEQYEVSRALVDSPGADDLVMESEIVTAMQLMGVSKLDQLRPEMVECLQEIWK